MHSNQFQCHHTVDGALNIGSGPFNCVGKRLALVMARLALSYTVFHYDFELAPGEDGKSFLEQSRNQIILKPRRLSLVFDKLATW